MAPHGRLLATFPFLLHSQTHLQTDPLFLAVTHPRFAPRASTPGTPADDARADFVIARVVVVLSRIQVGTTLLQHASRQLACKFLSPELDVVAWLLARISAVA